jgi:flagellar protein FlaJ
VAEEPRGRIEADGGAAPDGTAAGTGRTRTASARPTSYVPILDRLLYALFARHADAARHERDRRRYRGTDLRTSFDVYLARVYGLSWVGALSLAVLAAAVAFATPARAFDAIAAFAEAGIPLLERIGLPRLSRVTLAAAGAVVVAAAGKRAIVWFGGQHLRWRAGARRANIQRTLPGAVRYLHVLSSGSDGHREMLRRVAATGAYGETAVALRKALNAASLTGSLDEGLRRVARDTPSRDSLAPFLLKLREHADQGPDALANYLRMESRMLGHRQDRARERAEGFLELLAEMFIVLLVLPSLLVIILTVMSVIAPGLSDPIATPLGTTTVRGVVVYASAAFILVVGAGASSLVAGLRPPDQVIRYDRPSSVLGIIATAGSNPASAGVAFAGVGVGVAAILFLAGYRAANVVLIGYVAYAVPVGTVAIRRARIDDAKDCEIKDFVHAVSGHVTLGRPFPKAVEHVARDVDFGPLNEDVADLALNINLTTPHPEAEATDLRTAALDRFVERVGTPLAAQSIGLVTGALESGSDAGTIFDTLQTEIGRLYHEKRALRSSMLVYVAIGWTTALLVVGITVAVSTHVFDGFAQLSTLSTKGGFVVDPDAIRLSRERFRIYVVTQATMIASGTFAGTASRGRYEALLHSGALVAVCYVVFAGAGMI